MIVGHGIEERIKMTKCCRTGINVKCPKCGGPQVAFYYDVGKTIIYCQNKMGKKPDQCDYGTAYVTYHSSHPEYPKIIGTEKNHRPWVDGEEN